MKQDLVEIGRLVAQVIVRCWGALVPYLEVPVALALLIFGLVHFSWIGALSTALIFVSCASVALVRLVPTTSAGLAFVSFIGVCGYQIYIFNATALSAVTPFVLCLLIIVCFDFTCGSTGASETWAVRAARSYFTWLGGAVIFSLALTLIPMLLTMVHEGLDSSYWTSQSLGIILKLLGICGTTTLVWLAGYAVRIQRENFQNLRSQRQTEEKLRQADVELRLTKERDRIAQDVHDIMAHSLSVIVAQSDGARLIREQDPRAVDGALHEIAASARTSLTEVRMLIESLVNSPEGHSPEAFSSGSALGGSRWCRL